MSQIPLTVKLSGSAAPLMAAITELSELLVNAPDEFVERLLAVSDSAVSDIQIDSNPVAAGDASELSVSIKPGRRMQRILATARASEFDLSVFDFLDHDSSSVGCFDPSNEERAPAESQGSVGACPHKTHGGAE